MVQELYAEQGIESEGEKSLLTKPDYVSPVHLGVRTMIKVRMVKTYEKVVELEVEDLDTVGCDLRAEMDWENVPMEYVDTNFVMGQDYKDMKEGDIL